MNVFRRDPDVFYREGDDVVVYPVEAARVAAFLSGGGEGVTVRGDFTEDDVVSETDSGAIVQSPDLVFETTHARAKAAGIVKDRSAVEFDGRVFTVIRCVTQDPSFVRVWLRAEGF